MNGEFHQYSIMWMFGVITSVQFGIIVYFLSRLITRHDKLEEKVALHDTSIKVLESQMQDL